MMISRWLLIILMLAACAVSGISSSAASLHKTGQSDEADREEDNILYLQIGSRTFTATLAKNSSTDALKKLLTENPITIDMRDYGKFEKIGGLGTSLPTNDEQITTKPGDLMLYQGNELVIFYAPNAWSYTRLGKINNITPGELKEALGSGNITVTLTLSAN